jgi:hypothetical protein
VTQEPVRIKYRSLPPAEPHPSDDGRKLDLKVVFTDLPRTAAALTTARAMARGLRARITLMVAQVVPYPLPLAAPDVPVEFTERLLESIAAGHDDADTTVEIYLCRDRIEAIRGALPPHSVVIVGTQQKRWGPSWLSSPDRRLTRTLRQDGQRVLVVTA